MCPCECLTLPPPSKVVERRNAELLGFSGEHHPPFAVVPRHRATDGPSPPPGCWRSRYRWSRCWSASSAEAAAHRVGQSRPPCARTGPPSACAMLSGVPRARPWAGDPGRQARRRRRRQRQPGCSRRSRRRWPNSPLRPCRRTAGSSSATAGGNPPARAPRRRNSYQSVVLTAGHCVNQVPGSYDTNWTFAPAYNDGSRPFGTWPAVALDTMVVWRTRGHVSGATLVLPPCLPTARTRA